MPSKRWNTNFRLEHSDWELGCFPLNQNFRKLGNSGKWYRNFPEKFPEIPKLLNFLMGTSQPKMLEIPGANLSGKKTSAEKFFANLGIPREVVFFDEILKNAVPFATGSCRKFKPDFLVEWKAPRTSISDVLLLPEATWPRLFKRWIALSTG